VASIDRWGCLIGPGQWSLGSTRGGSIVGVPVSTTTVVAARDEPFSANEQLALAGFLAGYSGLTRDAYKLPFFGTVTHDPLTRRTAMADIRPAAAVLALLGSLGVGFGAYLDWLDGRAPDEIPIRLLVDDITSEAPSYWRSLALPLGIASVVGILGVLLRSRGVVALAFIAGLGTFVWWTVREADLRDQLEVSDFEVGVWVLVGSAAALLIGGATLRRFSRPGHLGTRVGPDPPVRPLDTGA
jgi:hypothetical protein